MPILIKGATYLIAEPDKVLQNQDLYIEDEHIKAIGSPEEVAPYYQGKNPVTIDGSSKVVMPGFVNGHAHLYQNFLKGRGNNLALKEWCDEVLFPFAGVIRTEAQEERSSVAAYYWTALASMEMVRSGITSCINMDLIYDEMFQAWSDLGFRGIAAITCSDQGIPPELLREPEEARRDILDYIERWKGHKGLLDVFLGPSTIYLSSPDLLNWVRKTADEKDLGTQIHIAETRWEVEDCKADTGYTPLGYLNSLGFLEGHVTAPHCIHLEPNDLDIIAEKGVIPVYNPKSNMRLGSGIAPIAEMLKRGITVSIATDGAASNDLLDMFEEMRVGTFLQRVALEDAAAVSAEDAFAMATVNGARAAKIDAGVLRPGALADVIVVEIGSIHQQPINDLMATLVFCCKSSDVQTVIINGRIVMEDRVFPGMDEGEILSRSLEIAREKVKKAYG